MYRSPIAILLLVSAVTPAHAGEGSDWSLDAGLRFFKHSATGQPREIGTDPVFPRWEAINQSHTDYAVSDYAPLGTLYFNMNFGIDLTAKYRRHLLIRLAYDYSNPLGIGGAGHIEYSDIASGATHREEKSFSYTTHQVSLMFGPVVPTADDKAEIYLGFAPMAPTWIRYHEKMTVTRDGQPGDGFDRTWTGFFGSCRAVIGAQVAITDKLTVGSEAEFVFLSYMKLSSGDLEDHTFQFPAMKWNFTARYRLF